MSDHKDLVLQAAARIAAAARDEHSRGMSADFLSIEVLAIHELCSVTTWRDIDTAPKDGTHIWAYVPVKFVPKQGGKRKQFYYPRMAEIWWCAEYHESPAHEQEKHTKELLEKHGGYWTAHRNGFRAIVGHPSHWMPLPAAPVVAHSVAA